MAADPTERQPAPPTVLQGTSRQRTVPTTVQDTPRRQAPTVTQGAAGSSVPTVTQVGSGESVPTVTQAGGGQPASVSGKPGFPSALLDRFEPVRVLGSGSEAAVWEVRRRESGELRAVKVHRPDQPMEIKHLERLSDARFRRHVPRIFGYDELHTQHGTIGWVELELLPKTLAELIAEQAGPGGIPVGKAKDLVAELAEALRFWQEEIELNPIDFKPDNFLVRPGRRVQLVLADFGGLSAFTASQEVGRAKAAVAYMPPEDLWDQKNRPWPWWSLGRIVVEMVTGQARYRDAGGRLRDDRALIRDLVLGTPDLASLPDDRWRRLVSGLLTRRPEDRWGYRQVKQWLDGGNPPVAQQGLPPAQPGPKHEPITFDGAPYHDPAELAEAMLQRWRQAADWLAGDGQQRLWDWLGEIKEVRLERRHYLKGLNGRSDLAHRTVTAFGAAVAPQSRPRYRGEPIDAEGLPALLTGGPTGFTAFRELVDRQILSIAAGYRCGHAGCGGGRCAVLGRLADDVPLVVTGVERAVAAAGQQAGSAYGGGWPAMDQGERDRAHGLAGVLTLQPDRRKAVLSGLGGGSRQGWWRQILTAARSADAGTIPGRTALVAAAILVNRRRAADGQARQTIAVQQGMRRRALRLRLGGTALVAAAMVSAAGTGAWIKALNTSGLGRSFDALTASGGVIGEAVARQQYRLLPALVLLAIVGTGLSRGRAVAFVASIGTAATLGYLAVGLPDFWVGGPAPLGDLLLWLGGRWTGKGVVVLPPVYAAVAIALGIWAQSVTATSERLLPHFGLPVPSRRKTRLSRLAAAPVALVALLTTLWVAAVVRATAAGSAGGEGTGLVAGYYQSTYALALAIAAVVVCLLQPPGGRTLLGWTLVAVIARILWWKDVGWLRFTERSIAADLLSRLGGAPGDNAFWVALLVGVPVAALATAAARRMLSPN